MIHVHAHGNQLFQIYDPFFFKSSKKTEVQFVAMKLAYDYRQFWVVHTNSKDHEGRNPE